MACGTGQRPIICQSSAAGRCARRGCALIRQPANCVKWNVKLCSLSRLICEQLVKESGPAHMRTYVTCCRCGELTTEGDGSSKKLSKKRAAEKMVIELKKLPPLSPPPPSTKPKKIATKPKQTKNLIKATEACIFIANRSCNTT